MLDLARRLFSSDSVPVSVIRDSGGFVAQRMVANIINTAAEIAQQRIATPSDIDIATCLGLGYALGPLSLGDRIGPKRIVAILSGLVDVYGDPRYRPGVWLSRRAALGLSMNVED